MEVDRATTAAEAGDSSWRRAASREPLMPSEMGGGRPQFRKVPVPSHRFAPLKKAWMEIYTTVYEHMKVDVRMNLKVTLTFLSALGSTLLLLLELKTRRPSGHPCLSNVEYAAANPD